jgi:hypothetical protein
VRRHSRRLGALIASVASLLLLVSVAGTSTAATRSHALYVDDDGHAGLAHGCTGHGDVPTRIQKAVDAAEPGDTILVCPGRYRGYVTISGSGKDGLIIRAARPWTAIVEPPVVPTAPYCAQYGHCPDLVRISGTNDVQLRSLSFVAPTTGDCQHIRVMVHVTGHSTGVVISDDHILATGRRTLVRRCGYYIGLQVEGASDAWADGNVIQNFSTSGMVAIGAGTTATISHNRVLFYHRFESAPEGGCWGDGILVGRGGTGTVRANDVASLPLDVSRPFLCDGIVVLRTVGSTIARNTIRYSNWGIETVIARAPLIEGNSILSAIGLHLYDQTGGIVTNNVTAELSGGWGIWVAYNTSDVRISDNDFRGQDENRYYDCRDHSSGSGTAGTANRWMNNLGDPAKSDPSGICSLPVSHGDGARMRGARSRQAIGNP